MSTEKIKATVKFNDKTKKMLFEPFYEDFCKKIRSTFSDRFSDPASDTFAIKLLDEESKEKIDIEN